MRRFYHVLFSLLLCFVMVSKSSAQSMSDKMSGNSESGTAKLVSWDIQGTFPNIIDLAEAMPADDYSWSPMKGVRTVSQVYVHIAMTNYFLISGLGAKMPEDFDKDAEKNITDKAKVMAFLKQSFDDTQKFLDNYTDNDYDAVVKLPFGSFTKGQVLMILAGHAHEHLGQAIAYARMNNIVPPWSK